jgi:peptide/nickel transport system ATP-binding protein
VTALLEVEDLHVHFESDRGTVRAVDGISFSVDRGETLGIVGESGSGKTVASEALTRLLRMPPGGIPAGSVRFEGRELTAMSEKELRRVRGADIAYVFQDPETALNPVYSVGWQLREAIQLHSDASDERARERAIELLDAVGIPDATARVGDYPHEFSGGMRQRAVVAMALASDPKLLVADEPTTALDATVQAGILELLTDIQRERDMGVLLITHDLGVIAEVADRVAVLYAGKLMETADVYGLFDDPAHPYTRALFACLPGRGGSAAIEGTLPDPTDPPPGCRFAPRCRHAVEACHDGGQPPMYDLPNGGTVSCVHYGPNGDPSVLDAEGTDTAWRSADAEGVDD